jgi:hypothetical protein
MSHLGLFYFLDEVSYVAQAGLELLEDSSNLPASVS